MSLQLGLFCFSLLLSVSVFVRSIQAAPIGFEDETGFHVDVAAQHAEQRVKHQEEARRSFGTMPPFGSAV